MDAPILPPLYTPVVLPGPGAFDHACGRAGELGAAALVWTDRRDRLELAVVLEPEEPLGLALRALYVGSVALGDAIGALGPPNKPVTFGWPDRVEVDGACVGGVRLAAGPVEGGVPSWLVLGAEIDVTGDLDDPAPGRHVGHTALWEEGFGEVEAPALVESFSRFFLSWTGRYVEEGFAPVRDAWLARAPGRGRQIARAVGGGHVAGRFEDVDDLGALVLADGRRVGIEAVLGGPTWRPRAQGRE